MKKQVNDIEIPVWWKRDGIMTRRSCLPDTHPESDYQYVLKMGYIPEEFGIFTEKHYRKKALIKNGYDNLTEDQLLDKIVDLELQIESMMRLF